MTTRKELQRFRDMNVMDPARPDWLDDYTTQELDDLEHDADDAAIDDADYDAAESLREACK